MSRRLVQLLFILGVFHVARGGFLDWIRGKTGGASGGHSVDRVYIEVLEPRGVRLWTHYNPDTVLFGVELYVRFYGGQTEALECGLCRNTSEPIDGKFMLESDSLVARFGDVLQYTIITSDGATTERHRVRRMFVREELIKPAESCRCLGTPHPPPALQDAESPISEVQLLERMIMRALANRSDACESISNWLVLHAEPRNERADLEEYVRSYLDVLHLRSKRTSPGYGSGWIPSRMVVSVEDHADGIAFQVRTTMDKLKMLELLSFGGVLADFDRIL